MSSRRAALPAALALSLLGCSGTAQKAAGNASMPQAGADDVVAVIDGAPVTREDVDSRAGGAMISVRQKEYEIRRSILDQIVVEKLLTREASARGMSTEELLTAEVDAKVPAPSRLEVDRVYQQVAARLGGRSRDEAAPEITRLLRQQAIVERRHEFARELKKKAEVRIRLEAPRLQVAVAAGAPAIGPEKAPVTIVEYLDYQCPYCQRAAGTVDQLLSKYEGKVRFVHRDFPIEGHPRAFPASRAARCAGEQGRFWEYHRALLAPNSDFSDEGFRGKAKAVGLDVTAFSTCLASDRHDADIKAAEESGNQLGVSSTPTFFVNGRLVLGARPLEDFQQVIDEELAAGGTPGR